MQKLTKLTIDYYSREDGILVIESDRVLWFRNTSCNSVRIATLYGAEYGASQLKILLEIQQFLGRNGARLGAQVCSCASGASAPRSRHVRFYLKIFLQKSTPQSAHNLQNLYQLLPNIAPLFHEANLPNIAKVTIQYRSFALRQRPWPLTLCIKITFLFLRKATQSRPSSLKLYKITTVAIYFQQLNLKSIL